MYLNNKPATGTASSTVMNIARAHMMITTEQRAASKSAIDRDHSNHRVRVTDDILQSLVRNLSVADLLECESHHNSYLI